MAVSRVLTAGACGLLSAGLLLPVLPGRQDASSSDGVGAARQATAGTISEAGLWLVPADMPSTVSSLARAIDTLSEGDVERAIPGLRQAADDPVLGPYALLYLGRAELVRERPAEAAAAAQRILDAAPGGYVGEAALWLLADAEILAERWAAALEPLRTLTALATADAARAYLELAEAAEKAGDLTLARASYATVYYDHPLSDAAREAGVALGRLSSPSPTPVDLELARAERLYEGHRYADARLAYADTRPRTEGETRAFVDLRIAQSDLALRQYAAARARLAPLRTRSWARRAEVEYAWLGVLRGGRRDAEYVASVDAFVTRYPGNPLVERALDELGTHYILTDDDEAAAGVFTRLYALAPGGTYGDRAAWKAGWWAYRQRDLAEAVQLFTSAAKEHPRADYRPSWLYWAGRAQERLGQAESAAELYGQAVLDYRNSYYGREATRRLEDLAQRSVGAAREILERPSPPLTVSAGAPPANTPIIQSLLRAGLFNEAVFELRQVQRVSGRTPLTEATVAYALYRAGQLRPAITAMRRAYPEFMAAGGERLPVAVRRVIFPIDHWDLLQRYADQHEIDRHLLAAQVAQESTFQADVRSAANAWGLMQILPSTGQRLARQLGIRNFSTARLTDPETNVRMGTHYLATLVKQLGGVAPALAGYNAGEHRVLRWQAERPGLDRDEFIDDIPYPETQFYVKRILGTADDYRTLYGSTAPQP